MKHELPYFYIGSAYGGNQDWLTDRMMNLGGCAAVTACDSSIYFTRYKDAQGLYPYETEDVAKKDYIAFTNVMKPYLRPLGAASTASICISTAWASFFLTAAMTTSPWIPGLATRQPMKRKTSSRPRLTPAGPSPTWCCITTTRTSNSTTGIGSY